ncbi:MAG TPA: stalk domain-containing protein [Armatimonadota bacterium]|nr:stalk domain-containing protein [Armatimonadota bacterium]
MKLLGIRKATLARIALALVWVFALQVLTAAGADLVRITAPRDGEQVKGRVRVSAQTRVDDPSYLIFCVDDRRPHSTNSQPYAYDLDTTKLLDGAHALAVEVYGRAGLVARSSPVTIRVANERAPLAPVATVQRPPSAAPHPPITSAAGIRPVAPAPSDSQPKVLLPMLMRGPAPVAAGVAERAPAPPTPAPSQAAASVLAEQPTLRVRPQDAVSPRLTVILDGRELEFDVALAITNGRTYGALRTVIEQSGGRVDWIGAAKQAIARRAGAELRVTIGSLAATFDGRAIELTGAPVLTDGRTVVPLRGACEPMGLQVVWSPDSRTVRLCSVEAPVQVTMLGRR